MKAVLWTPEAIQDRDIIYERIEADNPAAAADLDELFERKSGALATHSALGATRPRNRDAGVDCPPQLHADL